MEVDFRKVKVQMSIEGDPSIIDLAKEMGNHLFSKSGDIELSDFGKEIYYKGEVDIPESYIKPILALVDDSRWVAPVKRSLIELLTAKNNQDGTDRKNNKKR